MTDFTTILVDSAVKTATEKGRGGTFVNQVQKEQEAEEEKAQQDRFQTAYSQSGLDAVGIADDKYDFRGSFDEGTTFQKNEGGGVLLPNRHVKENGIEIAGRDFKTSKQMRNKWGGEVGDIESGIAVLRNSSTDTATGPPWDTINGLNRIALGMYKQDGTFDDFRTQLANTPWAGKPEQAAVAWKSAIVVKDSMDDAKSGGQHWGQLSQTTEVEGHEENEPDPQLLEADLPTNADWVSAAKTIISYNTGEDSVGLTDQEASDQLLTQMGLFWNNLPEMMLMSHGVLNSENKEYAEAFLHAMNTYESTDMNNWNELARFGMGQISDLTNYVTFGGGMLVTRIGGFAMREGIKKSIVKMATGLGAEVALGGVIGAGVEKSRQDVEMGADAREEYDSGAIAQNAAFTAAFTAAIGAPLNVLVDPTLRAFASDIAKKGYANLNGGSKIPTGSAASQRGSVGVPPSAPKQPIRRFHPVAEFINKEMADKLDQPITMKELKKLQNKLTQAAHKGEISWEAMDWAQGGRLTDAWKYDIPDGAEDHVTTWASMRDEINSSTPRASLINYEPNFSSSVLNTDTPGYFEWGLSIQNAPGFGTFSDHYRAPAGEQHVGHIRGHMLDDALFIVEEQSDMARQLGKSRSKTTGGEIQQDIHFNEHQRGLPKSFGKEKYEPKPGDKLDPESPDEYGMIRMRDLTSEEWLGDQIVGEANDALNDARAVGDITMTGNIIDRTLRVETNEGALRENIIYELTPGMSTDDYARVMSDMLGDNRTYHKLISEAPRLDEAAPKNMPLPTMKLQMEIAKENNIDVFSKNAPSKIWDAADDAQKGKLSKFELNKGDDIPDEYREIPKVPHMKSWQTQAFREEIVKAIEAGKDKIIWPSNIDQIRKIEDWSESYAMEKGKGATNKLLKDKLNIAKRLGLEVTKVRRPDLVPEKLEDFLEQVGELYPSELTDVQLRDPAVIAQMDEIIGQIEAGGGGARRGEGRVTGTLQGMDLRVHNLYTYEVIQFSPDMPNLAYMRAIAKIIGPDGMIDTTVTVPTSVPASVPAPVDTKADEFYQIVIPPEMRDKIIKEGTPVSRNKPAGGQQHAVA